MHIEVAQKCMLNKQSDHCIYNKNAMVLPMMTNEQSVQVNGMAQYAILY